MLSIRWLHFISLLQQLISKKISFTFSYVYLYVDMYMHEYSCLWKPEEGIRSYWNQSGRQSSTRAVCSHAWPQSPLTILASPTPNYYDKLKCTSKFVCVFCFFIFFIFVLLTNIIYACYVIDSILDIRDSGIHKNRVAVE